MSFVLVIQDENVGDEFDVYGFAIYEKEHYLRMEREMKTMLEYFETWSDTQKELKGSYLGSSIEVYFGTNESQFYETVEDFAWKYKDITDSEKETIERLFGLGATRYTTTKGFFWLNRLYDKLVEWVTEKYPDVKHNVAFGDSKP